LYIIFASYHIAWWSKENPVINDEVRATGLNEKTHSNEEWFYECHIEAFKVKTLK
jgi:hypothetical protein